VALSGPKGHIGCAWCNPLQSVPKEDPDVLEGLGQLPTPWETPQPKAWPSQPVVLDSLFSLINPDSNDGGTGRVCTAASGNALFTVVDQMGIFDMEIVFCVCTDCGDNDAQLL
jgi:hypothetical protein